MTLMIQPYSRRNQSHPQEKGIGIKRNNRKSGAKRNSKSLKRIEKRPRNNLWRSLSNNEESYKVILKPHCTEYLGSLSNDVFTGRYCIL